MVDENTPENAPEMETEESAIIQAGPVSSWLTENGFEHELLEPDHLGVELIKVTPEFLIPLCTALYAYGFNYLQCQGAFDLGPG